MDYSKKVTESENESDQKQENEAQIDAASPSSSAELSENSAHPCPNCPSVFSSSRELTDHLRDHNSPRSTDCSGEELDYSCNVCNKVLSSASSLDRHVLAHSGERSFKSKHCGATTNGNASRHPRNAHRLASSNSCTDSEGSSSSERPAMTNQDEYNNNNNEIARRNSPGLIDDVHDEPSPSGRASKQKCLDDDNSDTEEERRNRKILMNSRMMMRCRPKEEQQKTYSCSVCGQGDFMTGAILESHMERVHPELLAKCETYNEPFKNDRVLNLHRFTTRHPKKCADGNSSRNPRNTVDGFQDLTFIDFSSDKFPTIARAVCERELHRPASGEVNRFQCMKCLHAFPCKQAQLAHEKECRGPYKNKRNDNNNNDNSTNNNFEADLDAPSTRDDSKTKQEMFFAVLDLQNKASAHEAKEPKESRDPKEMKDIKDLADIPSILSVSLNCLQTFPRSDTSTPENTIRFHPTISSSGSSGTCSSEYNEEEAQDAFTAEFRKMKLKGEFPCRLCSTVFPNLRALKGHNRAHMNVEPGMPYPCNMCPFTSTDKGALMKHLRSHNGDRPFECSICNYAFTTKANCERHVKNRHGMISKEEVKNVLIYHPSEDSTNENVERSSPRVREEMRKGLVYPSERDETPQQQQIHYPPVPMDCNPGPSSVHAEMLTRYEKSELFTRPTKTQALNLVKRNAQEANVSHDLIVKPKYSKVEVDVKEDIESRSSDGSVSLVSDTKIDTHQRIQASPMNLTKPIASSSGEDAPLDLSMDVLDLSRKRKRDNEDSDGHEEKRFKSNQSDLYAANPALLLTQALLNRAREASPTSLENFYANTIYRNLGTLTGASTISQLIPSYFLNSHMFNEDLAAKNRQKELVKGLQLTGGGTLPVDTAIPSTSYAYPPARDVAASQALSEQCYPNLMANQAASNRVIEKTDVISSNDPVKMVLKNGVLIPKQKQRRYRTERPFSCDHCSARFTLRSNMERHIKQQHPQFWSQRPRGGHSTRGRPPASLMAQNPNSSASQAQPNILKLEPPPMITSDYNSHPISNQVKYAILAQQLKAKMDDNDSEDEMVIDEEETGDKDAQEPQTRRESGTSLLRDQLESNDDTKDVVVKTENTSELAEENSEESRTEQTIQNDVNKTNSEISETAEKKPCTDEEKKESTGREQIKLEDGAPDLASVSKLLDNASQQYQQFKPQYLSDEEGPVASTSGNNSGSEKSDSVNSNSNNASSNSKKKKKKKSAYSLAPNRVICPFCERPFPWSSSLRRHILTHTGQKPYQCKHCSHHFTTKSNCDRHLLRKHRAKANKTRQARNSSSPDIQVVATGNSSATSSNTFSMRNVPERPYKCNQCPSSTFSTLGNLKKHRSTKHRKIVSRSESSDQQNSPPQCAAQNDQSDYESPSSSQSDNSLSATAGTKSTTNAPLSALTETGRSRKSPRSSPGPGDVPFKCYLCDSGFAERQDCLEHIKVHHRRSYEMLKAKGALDMASMNMDAAEDQMMTAQQHHSDGEEKKGRFPDYSNRKVVCAFCMRRFWSAEDLRRHMRTHTGERPFECDICSRKFTLKHSMLRHRKKHESTDSSMYIGNSGDEENSPAQPPTITPSPISANTSRPRTQDRISLPTVAAVATADAAPCALMRYNHYDNMATLTGRMANDGSQGAASAPLSTPPPAEPPSESGDNDLISNLLGIREKGLLDKVLLGSADDAAKLLGVNHSE